MKIFASLFFLFSSLFLTAQTQLKVEHFPIGETSKGTSDEIKLELIKRFQHYNQSPKNTDDLFDATVFSPKSVNILESKNKFYVQNLEGFATTVYDLTTLKRIKTIKHKFTAKDQDLFQDTLVFNYHFKTTNKNFNIFSGKPVESCFSHNGKYLWVTYYRRDYDKNAIDPSAVAIIDTDTDEIVRVMPTGVLPKMIACSPDNNYIAITHWGDNTIGIIDISSSDYNDFQYISHFVVVKQLDLNFDSSEKVDRDSDCGFCLRGTTFSPDSKYLFVGRMGGGGIAVFDVANRKYLRTIWGMKYNLRHLEVNNGYLYIGTNATGFVERAKLDELYTFIENSKETNFDGWQDCYAGKGVRTIKVSGDGNYVFAAVNNENKIAVVRTSDMKVISTIGADSFPVGMDLAWNEKILIVTAQGKAKYGGGHSVMVYKITVK